MRTWTRAGRAEGVFRLGYRFAPGTPRLAAPDRSGGKAAAGPSYHLSPQDPLHLFQGKGMSLGSESATP